MPVNTITVKLPKPLFQKLEAEARRRKTSASQVLVEAFAHTQKDGNGNLSPYERVKDLIGSIEGPGDLSTNPKYLKGYGRRQRLD